MARTATTTSLALLALVAAGCPRPPLVSSADGGAPEGRHGPVDFLAFVHDTPAVGGDWYEYDEAAGHVITPLPSVYVVREGSGAGARYAALRVITYYDPSTADSGRFTVDVKRFTGGAWQAAVEWLMPANVKDGGPLCLDLFAAVDVECAGDEWQVQLRASPFLALEGPIVVTQPRVHVRSAHGLAAGGDVVIATLSGRTSLEGLPDPAGIQDLDDGPQPSWTSSSWERARYAVDVPERGMAVGARYSEGLWLLLNAKRTLARFSVRAEGDALVFTHAAVDVDIGDDTIPDSSPAPVETTVALPAPSSRALLTFESDELLAPVVDQLYPPPPEDDWDVAVVRADGGAVRLVLSAGSAVYNAGMRDGVTDLALAMPPTR